MSDDAAIKAALAAACATDCFWQGGEGAADEDIRADRSRAIAAFLTSMAEAGVSLAHMHEWHDLAARVQEAAKDA